MTTTEEPGREEPSVKELQQKGPKKTASREQQQPAESYNTPNTSYHQDIVCVEEGDEVVSEFKENGVSVRKRKRSAMLRSPFITTKRTRFLKSHPPCFDPFQTIPRQDVLAFDRWLTSSDIGVPATIRCGQAFQSREFFEILIKPQAYINSEHVDELVYLFRKRMQKFHDVFPKDICLFGDDFGQRIQGMEAGYRELLKGRKKGQKIELPLTDELKEYFVGKRPLRGRSWEGVNKFYIPWNYLGKHWVLLVVHIPEWTIVVYDSIPSICSPPDQLGKNLIVDHLKFFSGYFPKLLRWSGFFEGCSKNLRFMTIDFPKITHVPRNVRTGDCGVYMLKTMEMDIAKMCKKDAWSLLNDNNINTVRKSYAVQLYINSAFMTN